LKIEKCKLTQIWVVVQFDVDDLDAEKEPLNHYPNLEFSFCSNLQFLCLLTLPCCSVVEFLEPVAELIA
jgi:hypothetical protein